VGVEMPNIPTDAVARHFYYAGQNGCLKILTGWVWEMIGLERRAACPPVSRHS